MAVTGATRVQKLEADGFGVVIVKGIRCTDVQSSAVKREELLPFVRIAVAGKAKETQPFALRGADDLHFNEAFNFLVPCPDEEDLVATVCHRDASVFGGGDQDVCSFTLRLVHLIDAEGGRLDADFDMHDGAGSGRIHLQLAWYSFKPNW